MNNSNNEHLVERSLLSQRDPRGAEQHAAKEKEVNQA